MPPLFFKLANPRLRIQKELTLAVCRVRSRAAAHSRCTMCASAGRPRYARGQSGQPENSAVPNVVPAKSVKPVLYAKSNLAAIRLSVFLLQRRAMDLGSAADLRYGTRAGLGHTPRHVSRQVCAPKVRR